MNVYDLRATLCAGLALFVCPFTIQQLFAGDYKPELYKSAKLVYENDFDEDGPLKSAKRWLIKQETQWHMKNGILTGRIAKPEFTKKMQAIGDTHDGTRPVLILKNTPKEIVMQMRLRYNGKYEDGKQQLLDLGHHINTLNFQKDKTMMVLGAQGKRKKVKINGELFPLNKWADVTIELKEGTVLIKVNDRKEIIKNKLITLEKVRQIDFKGLKYGEVQLDWIRLYQGVGPK